MKRLLAVGLVLLTLGGCAGISVAGQPDAVGATPQEITTAQSFDRVQFRIGVAENGSARWTFQYQRTLENDTERQQFEEFAAHFNDNETDLYTNFRSQATTLARAGANATGREMTVTGFSRQAEVGGLDGNLGIVKMSFVWTNFAAAEGDRLVVGDVFEGGLYIGPNQSLVVEHGDSIAFAQALPEPKLSDPESLAQSDSVTWEGETEFADQRPRVVFEPAPPNETTTTNTTTSADGTSQPPTSTGMDTLTTVPPGDSGSNVWVMLGAGVVVLVGLVAALMWFGTDNLDPTAGSLFSPGDDGPDEPPAGIQEPSPPSVPEEELLTDEARVLQLLEDNGGRMKQVNIVEETGWSKSKVSMLLSEMADDGDISKLRMGRENIISLDGHEPDAARSPYEED